MSEVSPAKQQVFYTNEGFYDRATNTFVVARITEDEAGYDAYERYATYEAADQRAAALNAEAGIGLDVVLRVVASSMRLTMRDVRYEWSVKYEVDGIYAATAHEAAQQVADMLGEDYAQRAVYTVTKAGDEAWTGVQIDLSGEESGY